jgi:hypothetical protein
MGRTMAGRASVASLMAAAILTGCGGSAPAATSSHTATATAAPSASSSPASGNPAADATLTGGELPDASLSQISDGLLGGTPNTDARVFANATRTVTVEIDLAVDTGASAAQADYAAYTAAASKQITTQSSTKPLAMGTKAVEYVGVGSRGQNVVSIALLENTAICVVTYESASAPDPSEAEAITLAQAAKIQSAGL